MQFWRTNVSKTMLQYELPSVLNELLNKKKEIFTLNRKMISNILVCKFQYTCFFPCSLVAFVLWFFPCVWFYFYRTWYHMKPNLYRSLRNVTRYEYVLLSVSVLLSLYILYLLHAVVTRFSATVNPVLLFFLHFPSHHFWWNKVVLICETHAIVIWHF